MDVPTADKEIGATAESRASGERITLPALRRAVRDADPAAILVLPRILRRVIKQDRGLAGYLYRIPHRKSYVIDREPLLEIVDYEELGISPEEGLPDKVILLAEPHPKKLENTPAGEALLRCWRLLFHARVHLAVQQCFVLGFLSPSQVRKRIHQLGETEFDEIRSVLQHESFLLPPADDAMAYEEFAAVFLELKCFAPNSLQRFFPDLRDLAAAAAVVELDVNAEALLSASRPRGAPEPDDDAGVGELGDWAVDADNRSLLTPLALNAASPSAVTFRRLLRRAQRPATLGNVVRAAIWRAKAIRFAPTEMVARTKIAVRDDVNSLIVRLHAALELEDASPQPWHDTLRALVYSAAEGFWTVEGRLLYDLQKVCVDHERVIYSTNFWRWFWAYSVFLVGRLRERFLRSQKSDARPREGSAIVEPKRSSRSSASLPALHEPQPLRQPLPNQRDVLMSQHLRTAERRLTAVRLPEKQRKQLAELLRAAIARVESRLRERFRPLVLTALDEAGLTPANFPEKVARHKLVEELLDQVAERGFLSIGDLRDALSRNNMKLPDFGGVKDLFYGDPLLKADRRLGEILRGIYRPAEFYLRWLQQLTSLSFGTRIGRFSTLYLAVPFGGAFLIEKFVGHLFQLYWEHFHQIDVPDWDKTALAALTETHVHRFDSPLYWLPLGAMFFGLVNFERFRKHTWRALKDFWKFLGDWLYRPLWRIVHSKVVQIILHSRAFRLAVRFAVKPTVWTALIWLAFPLRGVTWPMLVWRAAILFLALNLLLNSRVGRTLEETIADWTVQTWQRYGLRFILGVFWWTVDLFKTLLETVERLMYSVDEWLRFKSGDSQSLFGAKVALAMVWAGVAYVMRFCVSLLIEPQINPLKHFPVVTVSHKLLLPLVKPFGDILAAHMEKEWAYPLAFFIIAGIPGIFGFIVWELKENWRLYAANRPKALQPMAIGSHGETMGRLLRPGLHSGTIPKLYAKLRRAERKARKTGNWKTVRKHLHGFEHVEMAIRRYVERDFLATLNRGWQSQPPSDANFPRPVEGENVERSDLAVFLREIQLGTNRVRMIFAKNGPENPLAALDFDTQAGWLIGGVQDADARSLAEEGDRAAFSVAILGLYKTAGAELVRQQIETAIPASVSGYDLATEGLRMWPDSSFETEVLYQFDDEEAFRPQVVRGVEPRGLPVLARSRILFREFVVSWRDWVRFWDALKRGKPRKENKILTFPVLPKSK
jgi:hypothetical protein